MNRSSAAPARPAVAGPSGRTAAVVLVAAILVAMLALPVRSWFLQQARIAEAEEQLAATVARVDALEEEQRQWSDEQFLEEQARIRLNYVYPGEVGVVVLRAEADGPGPAEEPRTWFEALWQTVDAASGRGESTLGDPAQVRPTAPR